MIPEVVIALTVPYPDRDTARSRRLTLLMANEFQRDLLDIGVDPLCSPFLLLHCSSGARASSTPAERHSESSDV